MGDDPQAPVERRAAARHLVQNPLCCKEHDPDTFRLIRRHEADLDRWFTQRLGYRLHVDTDTARLFKAGYVPANRPLRTTSGRPFHQNEYVLLALVLASTAAGPAIISLRDLVDQVRSAAAECDITLVNDASERRSLVATLRWMVDHGLATELHSNVDAYASDDTADAILKVRPDRIALLPLPALVGAESGAELLDRADRREATRQWMRCRLVEDPVLYRDDLTEAEWGELRRRLGDEGRVFDEMFGLLIETRAEGLATIDPTGALADQRFPAGGTVGHAALLLIERLRPPVDAPSTSVSVEWPVVVAIITELAQTNERRWANDMVGAPERLARRVVDLLVSLRLAEVDSAPAVRLLPAAARFLAIETHDADPGPLPQESLW